MTEYILAYHTQSDAEHKPDDGARQRWNQWIQDLGDSIVNKGTPLGASTTVTRDGVDEQAPNTLMGFSTVKADSLEEAIKFARSCPFTEMGSIEVAPIMVMND